MRGVAGQKDATDAKLLDHPNIRAPDCAPGQFAQPNVATSGCGFQCLLQTVERERYSGRRGVEDIRVVGAGQRREAEEGLSVKHPPVPVVVVQAVDAHIGQQHGDVFVGLTGERHRKSLAHRAATAVGADQIRRPQSLAVFHGAR